VLCVCVDVVDVVVGGQTAAGWVTSKVDSSRARRLEL